MKHFIESNRLEIIAGLIAMTGIWLLYDQLSSINTLQSGVLSWIEALRSQFNKGMLALDAFILHLSTADLVGFGLIVVAAVFIAFRTRYRFLRSVGWRSKICPSCGGSLHRVHRTSLDRLLERAAVLPNARRYRCSNAECKWSGLKHHEYTRHHQHLFDEEPNL